MTHSALGCFARSGLFAVNASSDPPTNANKIFKIEKKISLTPRFSEVETAPGIDNRFQAWFCVCYKQRIPLVIFPAMLF